jgi:SAM-dependent methyltransferase
VSDPFTLPGRLHAAELMDSDCESFEDYRRCISDLEILNRISLGYRPTLAALDTFVAGRREISVLDVGSGHGDMLRRIALSARQRQIAADLTGLDLNPWAARAAGEATTADLAIRYETGDLFSVDPERRFDVIVSSLFAHHLADEELLRFIRWMDRTARLGWFINDLHRHAVPYHFLRATLGLAGMHRFVRHDGPVSVRRAFTAADWTAALAAAGIPQERSEISWWFPFRWGVRVRTDGAA